MNESRSHPLPAAARAPRLLTRRSLLKLGFGALGALTVAGGAVRWFFWRPLKNAYMAVAYPALAPEIRGRLDAVTIRALDATAEALLGFPAPPRYRRYFEWHATHVAGYRAIYRSFADYLANRARTDHGMAFSDCSRGQKRAILSAVLDARADHKLGTDLGRIWRGVARKDLVQYDAYILREILDLYAKTDAWLAIGYDAFPGKPAGLDGYQRPPGLERNDG